MRCTSWTQMKTIISIALICGLFRFIQLLIEEEFENEMIEYNKEGNTPRELPKDEVIRLNIEPETTLDTEEAYFNKIKNQSVLHMTGRMKYILRKMTPKQQIFKAFMLSTANDMILRAPRLSFLSGLKNPCFASCNQSLLEGTISLETAISNNYDIWCLPYFFVAGFTKCGTTDLHTRMIFHEQILSGNIGSRPIKELHWFDNFHFDENHKLLKYVKMYRGATNHVIDVMKQQIESGVLNWGEQPILGDFTPRTAWHGDRWHQEAMNEDLDEPLVLIPHKVKTILPDAKIIFLLRNPAKRLLSDYNFQKFDHNNTSPQDFHNKVSVAIKWWKDCLALGLSEKRCAYGYLYPDSLQPPLDYANCIVGPEIGCSEHEPGNAWSLNPAPRLRIGLYYIFLKDWLKQFPRENLLILKFEEYVAHPLFTIEQDIFPFLGIETDFSPEAKAIQIEKDQESGVNKKKPGWYVDMLPETQEMLDSFYGEYNRRLVDLLQDDRFHWN